MSMFSLLFTCHCWYAAVLCLVGSIAVLHTIYAVIIVMWWFFGPIVTWDHLPNGLSYSFDSIVVAILPFRIVTVPPGLYLPFHGTRVSDGMIVVCEIHRGSKMIRDLP